MNYLEFPFVFAYSIFKVQENIRLKPETYSKSYKIYTDRYIVVGIIII